MEAEDSRPRAKGLLSLVAGTVLILFSCLMLLAVACWITSKGNVDFPCFDMGEGRCLKGYNLYTEPGDEPVDHSQARMYLCISVYPREFQGGGTIAQGPEFSDTWSGGGVGVERQGETLIVNGQTLAVGESFTERDLSFTLNPWLLASTRTTITNRGVFDCLLDQDFNEHPIDALYVYGSVSEGWFLNPVGPVVLVIGLVLLTVGILARRKSRVQEP
jgi:hypothetical protein